MTNGADIITLVMRSNPFCRPKLTTTKPATTVMAIQNIISPGLASMAPNTPPMASSDSPSKIPARNLAKQPRIPLEGEAEVEEVYMLWKSSRDNAALNCFLPFMSRFAPSETGQTE